MIVLYINFYFFIIGAIFGSFYNVCIYRIPKGMSLAFPPSRCGNCGTKIKWYDNIPIISYLLLKGKCRKCGEGYSIKYLLIEIFTGFIFLLGYNIYGFGILYLKFLIFSSLNLILAVIDWESYTLPDILTAVLLLTGIIFWLHDMNIMKSLIGAAFYSFPFSMIYGYGSAILKKEVMGFGDVKLAAGVGAYIGYSSFYNFYIFFLLTYVIGTVVALSLIFLKKKKRNDIIPFGPFISIGAVTTFVLFS